MAKESKLRRKSAPRKLAPLVVEIHDKAGKLLKLITLKDPRPLYVKSFNDMWTGTDAKLTARIPEGGAA